ncbi:MAG: hypothetical protein ACE5FL_09815 [Myxococcota bacterium]
MQGADDSQESFRRVARLIGSLLALVVFAVAGLFSARSPVGPWPNRIFGQDAWFETDPSASYVDAAHQLAWGEVSTFVGHPGTPLLLLLSGLQHATYALVGPPEYSFTEFTARHLAAVFTLSKLMMTALHLVSFCAVFAFSRRLLRDERAAFFATLGYATSLPVLYYLSRISVEPLDVICFVGSLLAIWRYQDLAAVGRSGAALAFVAVSAAVAVSGVVTKLNFLAPLPPFLMFALALGGRGELAGGALPARIRASALGVFVAVGALVAVFYSQFTDWGTFFRSWLEIASNPPARESWKLAYLLPGATARRAFLLCELAFLGFACAGWVALLRREHALRIRALWVSAFAGWGLLVFVYRAIEANSLIAFHYFHVTNVAVAVFFGYFAWLLLRRLRVEWTAWSTAAAGLLLVSAVHSLALWAVLDSRRFDIAAFESLRNVHESTARLEPSQRIGCVDRQRRIRNCRFRYVHVLGPESPWHPYTTSVLKTEFEALFASNAPEWSPTDEPARYVPAFRRNLVILEAARGPTRTTPPGRDE